MGDPPGGPVSIDGMPVEKSVHAAAGIVPADATGSTACLSEEDSL